MVILRRYDENGLRLYKVIFVPRALIMNTSSHMSFLGKIWEKTNIQIFRVAIFQLNLQILNLMGTLIKKLTPDSAYLWLKSMKNKIHFSRFLTINMQNQVLFFWSGFPFNSKFANLTEIWQPWKFKYLFFFKFYPQMKYDYLFLSYML